MSEMPEHVKAALTAAIVLAKQVKSATTYKGKNIRSMGHTTCPLCDGQVHFTATPNRIFFDCENPKCLKGLEVNRRTSDG